MSLRFTHGLTPAKADIQPLPERLPWRWVGVLHEYLTTNAPHRVETLTGAWIDRRHEGARSRDPETFRKDAAVLEEALKQEPGNARYAFYLAQSWRDAGDLITLT